MPSVSGRIELSDNGEFIVATGTYKPRVKCFDVNQVNSANQLRIAAIFIDYHSKLGICPPKDFIINF
jgi:hypothetical protein